MKKMRSLKSVKGLDMFWCVNNTEKTMQKRLRSIRSEKYEKSKVDWTSSEEKKLSYSKCFSDPICNVIVKSRY